MGLLFDESDDYGYRVGRHIVVDASADFERGDAWDGLGIVGMQAADRSR